MTISLIVSTYNRPDFLSIVLVAISTQIDQDFELIIADDGSTSETKNLIDNFISEHPLEVQHVWHEDDGFRKSEILNKSITAAKREYLVFLDGDCVPGISFISDHKKLARKNRIVGCSRILLDQTVTQHIIDNNLEPNKWSIFEFLKLRLSGHANRVLPLIRIPLNSFRNLSHNRWQKIRGCNFGIHREDFIKIGGFDESFTGWGYEDSELAVRAINSGCLVKRGDYLATVLHLWHQDIPRDEALSNKNRLNSSISTHRKTSISNPFSTNQV